MFHVKHRSEAIGGERGDSTDSSRTPSGSAVSEERIGRTDAGNTASLPQRIAHPLAPLFDERSRVLVLGTMPSPASREIGFYYGHPQNRFWRVLAALFDEPVPATNEERTALALAHRIALWDVLASCTIEGASDASIKDAVPNDLSAVIDNAPIEAVFTTGAKAASLYRRFCAPRFPAIPHTALPSTSPANARMRTADLVEAYRPLSVALEA